MRLRGGDNIGDWLVEGTLGEGSMGVVYRCRDLEFRSIPAAVKVSKSKLSPRARRRFIREAELLKELNHEAIIQIRNQGEDDQRQMSWFAMELLEGMTFRERIQAPPLLSVGMALSLFTRISDGLAYAHERNIYHRDLKPSNLFLCLDGSVRILDFGVGLAVEWSPLTATDQQMGTYAYMPPEVFRGKIVDPALGDIYGLGLVLYEVLIGKEIFLQPLTQMTTMKMNAEAMDLGQGFPVELRELLLEATHPDPAKRLESMQGFADRVLELSLEYPPEPEDQLVPDSLRAEIIARYAHSASAQKTLIPGGGPTTAIGTSLHLTEPPITATQVAASIPSAPPDSWLLEDIQAPIPRTRVLELIAAERISATTLIARPGSSWREIRYHPNFRAYFTPGSEAQQDIESQRRTRRSTASFNVVPKKRRLWPILISTMLVLVAGGGYAISLIPPAPEDTLVMPSTAPDTERRAQLSAMLAERWPAPQGDAATLYAEARAQLQEYTRLGTRAALEKLAIAGQLDLESAEIFAGLAEATARLEDTDDLSALTDLSLAHARQLSPDADAVSLAILSVERIRGHRSSAIDAGQECAGTAECDIELAAAQLDLIALDTIIAANPERPGLALVKLEVLLIKQDWVSVLVAAVPLLERLPEEPLIHRGLATAAAASGDWTRARTAAEQAATLEPGWLDMPHLIGRLDHRIGNDPATAVARLQAVTSAAGFDRYTDRAAAWRDLAAAALEIDDNDLAIKAADAAAGLDPSDPICRLQRAWAFHQKGDRSGFMSEISEIGMGSYSGSAKARLGLSFARMLSQAGLNRQALLELQGATEADPSYTPVWLALAGVQASLGDSKQVGQSLEAAALSDSSLLRSRDPLDPIWSPPIDLRPRPEQLKSLISRDMTLTAQESALMGILYWLSGDTRAAEPQLTEAIQDGTQSASVYAAMGQLMMEKRRYSDARAPLEAALQLRPGEPVLTAMYSYVLAILGKRREASVQLAGLSDHLDDPAFVAWKSRALIAAGEKNAAQTLLTRYLRGQQRDPIAWALMLELDAD